MNKPVIFAPAMNTRMLNHPVTQTHRDMLKSWGYIEIPTISKTLACGETGDGAMASVDTIADRVYALLYNK